MSQRKVLALAASVLILAVGGYVWYASSRPSVADEPETVSAEGPVVRVLKMRTCGCCGEWVEHLRNNGFRVETEDVGASELVLAKQEHGVPQDLFTCHTATVEGYTVEGHVPASDIRRLLEERPEETVGLGLPGMPVGSPGMERGERREPYDVLVFGEDGVRRVYASH